MAIIDLVKWNASEDLYAWKWPSESLSTATQLIVSESQEAVLLRGGRMFGPFQAGRHTLATENIPGLAEFFSIPFGGRSPFTAEVWFVNRMIPLDVKWGTADPILVEDPRYSLILPIRAHGQYGVQIEHARKFLTKLVGTLPSFQTDQLRSYFRGVILAQAKNEIARYIVQEKISVLEISAHLNALSEALRNSLAVELEEFGLRLVKFYVTSISPPENDPAILKVKEALARKAEMGILGFTYQQEQSFKVLNAAASNPGGGASGLVGAGIGLGMGVGMGQAVGGATAQMVQGLVPPLGGGSCPHCGAQQTAPAAAFCSGCGRSLAAQAQPQTASCAACGNQVPSGSRFCPGCGQPVALACRNCGKPVTPGAKFCAACGTSVQP